MTSPDLPKLLEETAALNAHVRKEVENLGDLLKLMTEFQEKLRDVIEKHTPKKE